MIRFRRTAVAVLVCAFALALIFGAGRLDEPVGAQHAFTEGQEAFAFESITVSTTAIGFTAATVVPSKAPSARAAFCTLEAGSAASIRYRFDGTDPTSSIGHYALAAVVGTADEQTFSLQGINNLLRFRAIRQGATDVTLRCTYLR